MAERNTFYLLVFLVLSAGVFCLFYFSSSGVVVDFFYNILSLSEDSYQADINLHLYNDGQITVNKVSVRVYYVLSKGEEEPMDDWQQQFSGAMDEVKKFYELQFADKMVMDYSIYPYLVYADNTAEYFTNLSIMDYEREVISFGAKSLAIEAISGEVERKISDSHKKIWSPSQGAGGSYGINLFVLEIGDEPPEVELGEVLGFNDEKNNSLVFSFVLTEEKFKGFSGSVIAQEIGHGLGIPDFYSYSDIGVESSGVMGEGLTRRLENNYIDYRIKEQMGFH